MVEDILFEPGNRNDTAAVAAGVEPPEDGGVGVDVRTGDDEGGAVVVGAGCEGAAAEKGGEARGERGV